MTTPASDAEIQRPLGRVKIQLAALLVGMPFYVAVVVLFLSGAEQALAFGLYGLASGGWVAWQTRRAMRGLAGNRSPEAH